MKEEFPIVPWDIMSPDTFSFGSGNQLLTFDAGFPIQLVVWSNNGRGSGGKHSGSNDSEESKKGEQSADRLSKGSCCNPNEL